MPVPNAILNFKWKIYIFEAIFGGNPKTCIDCLIMFNFELLAPF
jgi:hypothetical protein